MPVTSYSTTAGNNNGAPPNGAPEGCAPSTINDILRQIMADIAVEAQTGAVSTLNTIAGTDTITADMNPELTAYANGMIIKFVPANNNTGAATINIDGLGAKSIVKGDGTALAAGDLQASTMHVCMYDGTNFVLLNPLSIAPTAAGILAALLTVDGSGSGLDADLLDGVSSAGYATLASSTFSGTLTGMTGVVSGTFDYTKSGNIASLWYNSSDLTGTSNTTAMTMTGLPAAITPAGNKFVACTGIIDNGVPLEGAALVTTANTITFYLCKTDTVANYVAKSSSAFTNSGTKGLSGYFCITYPLT